MPIALFSTSLEKAGFRHGFFTRTASPEEIGAAVGLAFEQIRIVKQVHSARVLDAAAGPTEREEADAIVSRAAAAISIRTADCVPILIADPASGAVAAIHAGWRGVVSGVVNNALEMLGTDRKNWIAAVGPSICGDCFEVGADVAEEIILASNDSIVTKRVVKNAEEKAFVDLRKAVRAQLTKCGFADANIEDVAGCTYHQKDLFFSYRRDGANAGRLVAVIVPRA
jgi:YfiH family protein